MNTSQIMGLRATQPVRRVAFVVSLLMVLSIGACKRSEDANKEKQVSWPELSSFDEMSLRAERLARAGKLDELRKICPEVVKAGRAITPASSPSNVAKPQQVKTILVDLGSLLDGLSSELDDEALTTHVLGLHPVVENLMGAAGMPHVHAHGDGDHSHGHGDHAHHEHGKHDHSHGHDKHDHGEHDHGEHGHAHDHADHDHADHDHGDHDHADHDHADHDHGDHGQDDKDGHEAP